MLKIRRPLGRLIFNMGIAIPGKTVFLIETAPWKPPDPGQSLVRQPWNNNGVGYTGRGWNRNQAVILNDWWYEVEFFHFDWSSSCDWIAIQNMFYMVLLLMVLWNSVNSSCWGTVHCIKLSLNILASIFTIFSLEKDIISKAASLLCNEEHIVAIKWSIHMKQQNWHPTLQ